MDKNNIIEVFKNPSNLNEMDILYLENLVKEYPFFNTAQILLAKKYQLENHPDFEKQLKIAAISSSDRKLLFKFINSKLDEEETPIIATSIETPETKEEIFDSKNEVINLPVVEIEIPEKVIIKKEAEIIIEEKIEIENKNPEISQSGTHTFAEWMLLMQGKSKTEQAISSVSNSVYEIKKDKSSIEKIKEEEKPINVEELALNSLREDENIISATLAEIFANQGKFEKAIKLYEKLILQYPEKKDKFALKISELKSKL